MARELRTVTMNIKRRWFTEIVASPPRKRVEYREIKPYWEGRLPKPSEVPFKLRLLNGMKRSAPEAVVLVTKIVRDRRTNTFELHLGRVVKVSHWDRRREQPTKRRARRKRARS
jgi:hypothetical protein